jgi:DNA-binding CsgD family transcriptional regulator
MDNVKNFKDDILKLREEGLSYGEIKNILGCSKATISYHCKRWDLNDIGLSNDKLDDNKIEEISEYYKTHTRKETADFFNIGETTVYKYVDKKRVVLSESEKKTRNYKNVKSWVNKLKEKSIEYKGGKCEICGYDKCSWSMDFHHIDPNEKDFGIGSGDCKCWDKVKIELDKCMLVCKNCHYEIHFNLDKEKIK